MAATERVVLMGDRVAGTLARRAGGKLSFIYDDGYRSGRGATPISVSMPLQTRDHSDAVVTPWLWGLLPDNDRVLAQWARRFQVSPNNPFSLLATPVGEDCPGAVRIIDPGRRALLTAHDDVPGDVTWLTEADVAQRLRDLAINDTNWLGARSTGRFSLAGAQPKTALLKRDGKWGDPGGASATTHILKPAVSGLDEHDLNEHLCLAAMHHAGLGAVRTQVERFEDESAIVIARYDRMSDRNSGIVRLHQEDMCQALGRHPSAKYQSDGGPGPKEVTGLLRRTMPARESRQDVMRFVSALIWNWIIAGTDAHAKNYSLVLSGDQVALAPLYDVASALPYSDVPEQKLRFAMKFGSGYKINPVNPPWERLSSDVGLSEGLLRDRADHLLGKATDAFVAAAADPDVVRLGSSLPGRIADLVSRRVMTCRKLV